VGVSPSRKIRARLEVDDSRGEMEKGAVAENYLGGASKLGRVVEAENRN